MTPNKKEFFSQTNFFKHYKSFNEKSGFESFKKNFSGSISGKKNNFDSSNEKNSKNRENSENFLNSHKENYWKSKINKLNELIVKEIEEKNRLMKVNEELNGYVKAQGQIIEKI